MNLILNKSIALTELKDKELGFFVSQYGVTPNDFIARYANDWTPNDLKNKYVIAVEQNCFAPNNQDITEGVYCFKIASIYTPRHDQTAELMYCGHIAFVTVKDSKGKEVCKLYKDDECYPQSLDKWYENEIDWMIRENYEEEGLPPTKKEVIELIESVIKGYSQNPKLELNIKAEDIIILQGL